MAEAKLEGGLRGGKSTARLVKLLEVARELHDKQGAVLEEIDELLGGGAGIAEKMKAFEQWFDGVWGRRYAGGQSGRYIWRYKQDRPQVKRLVKMLGLEELQNRATRYIANDDPFLTRQRHPFGLFVSGINSYAVEGAAPDFDLEAPVIDCKHSPRCTSDQEHTRRKAAEVRA